MDAPPGAAARCLDLLARIRAQQGRLAEAEAYWTRALQLDPGNAAYAAGLRRIAHLQRPPLRRTPWPAVAALAAAGLVLAGGGLLGRQVGRLEGAVAGLADRAAALEQHIERVAQPSLQPTPEPDLAGPVRRPWRPMQSLPHWASPSARWARGSPSAARRRAWR